VKRTDRYSRLEEYFRLVLEKISNWFSKLRDCRIWVKDEQFNEQFNVAFGFLAVPFGRDIRLVNYFR